MSIVITTPSGNIGSAVTRALLDAGEKPVLIARDPTKVEELTDRGAVVKRGSHADADFLIDATRDAEALFVLTPGYMQTQDVRALYRRFAGAAAKAINANSSPYVVHLSSIGADLESGNGPVAGLYAAEKVLNDAGVANLTHLRPAYFMENTMMQIPNILQAGSLFTTFPEGTKFPMIATRDIGTRAADLLRKRDWSGTQVVELLGNGEVSYEEVALVLAKELGREIKHVTVSDEQLTQALTGMGLSQVLADGFVEMTNALTKGVMRPHEDRSEANTTPTTYAGFAGQIFKPAFEGAAAG